MPHGLRYHQNVAEEDGRIHPKAANRLQRDFGSQLGRLNQFEKTVFLFQRSIFGQSPPRLPHQPDWWAVHRLAMAGIEKPLAAVHRDGNLRLLQNGGVPCPIGPIFHWFHLSKSTLAAKWPWLKWNQAIPIMALGALRGRKDEFHESLISEKMGTRGTRPSERCACLRRAYGRQADSRPSAMDAWQVRKNCAQSSLGFLFGNDSHGGSGHLPAMPDYSVFADAEICLVGAICRDVKTAPMRPAEHLLHDGETSIGGVWETVGGGGANGAATAANLGAKARFAGLVGDDELGERLRQALERSGVRCFLRREAGLTTGTTVNLVYASGERHFLSCHPNNAALSFEGIDLGALNGAHHLMRADVWFSEPMLYGGNERLLREARKLGLATSLDLNWDPKWGHAPPEEIVRRKEAVRRVLPLVDLGHGNVRELCTFAGASDLMTALQKLAGWGIGAVVAHLGAEGSGYFASKKVRYGHRDG